jgi:hypothetical protein
MSAATIQVPFTFAEGWGVVVEIVWNGEDDAEGVAFLEPSVVRIATDNLQTIGNVACARVDGNNYVPIENFKAGLSPASSDSHDARSHWFATEAEAREHAESVAEQWANPLPWQSFIQTDYNT